MLTLNDQAMLELAKEYLRYEPETGHFYWIKTPRYCGKARKGTVAGSKNAIGYIQLGINGKRMLAHRLAYLMVHGELPKIVDHINRDRTDNRIANLRAISDFESNVNKQPHRKAASGLRGAYMYKDGRAKKYKAQARLPDGRIKFLGAYYTAEEAQAAYLEHYKSLGVNVDLSLDK